MHEMISAGKLRNTTVLNPSYCGIHLEGCVVAEMCVSSPCIPAGISNVLYIIAIFST